MKGTFFKKPLEIQILIEGENFQQGQNIQGKLLIKNLGSKAIDINLWGVNLCFGDYKKVKLNNIESFEIIDRKQFEIKSPLLANQTSELDFNFHLSNNALITESSGGVYLSVSEINEIATGSLELPIKPHPFISKIIEIIERFYRFKIKTIKNKKDQLEFKLIPPLSKDHSHIQQLDLSTKLQSDNTLNLKFNFRTNKINLEASTLALKKQNEGFNLNLTSKDYLFNNSVINQELVLQKLQIIFDDLKANKKMI